MKQFAILVLCLFSYDLNAGDMKITNTSEIIESLTESSFGGYSFEDLLNPVGERPSSIFGGKVYYLEKDRIYVPGATVQVQIQLSKTGLHIPVESVVKKTRNFNGVVDEVGFGQHDISWTSANYNCSVSVHSEDDIFELSCWY